jgi:hypothetical protein
MPPPRRIWETPASIQWCLAWAWRVGAGVGLILCVAQIV